VIALAAPLAAAPQAGARPGSRISPPAQPVELGPLRPCPFCGGGATVEADPWTGECVRIACGDDACRVAPRTEYLLVRYADELRDAWNGRSGEAKEPA
jgi:hypothetical protein